jgi:hypothetical protein
MVRHELVLLLQFCRIDFLAVRLFLSMIKGATFESKWGQLDLAHMIVILKKGGQLTPKREKHLAGANEKGGHLLSQQRVAGSTGVAQTVPESSPDCAEVSPVLLPVHRLPQPAPRSRLPMRVSPARPHRVKAGPWRWGLRGMRKPRPARLGLDTVGYTWATRTGGSQLLSHGVAPPSLRPQQARFAQPAGGAGESGTTHPQIRECALGA